jgi:hypothetical protein
MKDFTIKGEYNTVDEKIELIFDIIKTIDNENISNIMLNSLGQGVNLIVSLFDEDGNYKEDKKKETIDTIAVFESFFNVKIDKLITDYMNEHIITTVPDNQTDFVADSTICDFIVTDEDKKTDEEYKKDIKEKLNFINSVIDKV